MKLHNALWTRVSLGLTFSLWQELCETKGWKTDAERGWLLLLLKLDCESKNSKSSYLWLTFPRTVTSTVDRKESTEWMGDTEIAAQQLNKVLHNRLMRDSWQTFVVVSVSVGIVAFSINLFVLLITQVNAGKKNIQVTFIKIMFLIMLCHRFIDCDAFRYTSYTKSLKV